MAAEWQRQNFQIQTITFPKTTSMRINSAPGDTVKYSAYGEIRAGGTATDYLYTSQRNELEIGLDYYVARFYDPVTAHFIQADTIVPEAGSSKAYDRYGYVNNIPISHNDPSDHWPEWFDKVGQFFTGFGYEFVRTSNWMGAITSPSATESLAPSTSETNIMLAGRITGDIAAIALGVTEIVGGGTIAGGGAVVGCGTTLCLTSAPAIAAGATVVAGGVVTTTSGSVALGSNLSLISNGLKPISSGQAGNRNVILQKGGHTLSKQVWEGLDINRNEAKRAVEALKKANGLRNDTHFTIMSNGDYLGSNGEYIDNILDYLP